MLRDSDWPACCGIAFKEWAAVCAALASGRQAIIVRKGGIHEGSGGFRVEHADFWLLPTHFHQSPAELIPAAADLAQQAAREAHDDHLVRLRCWCRVTETRQIADPGQLGRLGGLHIWSDETLARRFHYRRPGLHLLLVRAYLRPQPFELIEWPELPGCKSWATLPVELPTAGLEPVLSDEEFACRRQEILTRLA